MLKKLLIILFCFSFITLSHAELKLGFVKVDEILRDAPQASESNKKLEKEFKARTEKLKKDIEALNNQEKDFSKNSLTMSDKDKEKTQRKLQQNKIDIQRSERELREDIDLRRREEINKLQNEVTKVIQKIAEEEKFDLIFYTGVAYASDQVNVTENVLKALGGKK